MSLEDSLNNKDPARKYVLKGSPRLGLTAATFGFFVGFAAVALIGPVGVKFKEAMGLSASMLGLLVAAPQLAGSLLRIPFGAWVDKVGGKKPLLTLLLISIVGLAGMSLILFTLYPSGLTEQMFPLILLLAVLSGAGVATFSVGIPQTSYWFPKKKQGWALGTYAGLGNTAPGIFTLILPFVLVTLGLPGSYAAWFLFVVFGTLIYGLIAYDAPYFQLVNSGAARDLSIELAKQAGEELIPSGQLVGALKKSAKSWRNWALVALYFNSFGGFLALTTWFPSYWSLYHGLDVRSAAILTAVAFSLLASFVRVGGGQLSDKYGGENIAFASFLLVLVGAAIMVITQSFLLDVIGGVVLGTGMGLGNAAVFKLVAKYVPEAVGGASGWVGGLGAFGGFVVPPILGSFVDYFGAIGYSFGFVVYVILAIMALLITIVLRTRPPTAKAEG
jgi:NNP family nitrate/nitrite transporter-like MFS transporter